MKKSKVGRKSVMTQEVLGKLTYAFSIGCSDREASIYAGINPDTLYTYQRKNPQFSEQKVLLKTRPILQARITLFNAISVDPKLAFKYLERKCKKEFNLRYINTHKTNETQMSKAELKRAIKLLEMCGENDL